MEILKFVKVYFSEQEQQLLKEMAKQQNISLSQLIKKQCLPLLQPSYETMSALLDLEDVPNHSSERFIKVYLSKQEYQQILEASQRKGWSMSRIIYERLHEKNIPIEIICQTEDIFELTNMISDTYKHLIGTATALMQRSIITEHEKNRILSLGYEIRDALQEYTKQAYRNRNSIRKNVSKHLNKKLDKILNDLYSLPTED